ncbi:MAG: type III pantothenate kinase [Spirosomataceae bacterium]
MLIVIDAGNSDTVFGLVQEDKLVQTFRVPSLKEESFAYFDHCVRTLFFENQWPLVGIQQVILSSVVPPLTPIFQQISRQTFGINPILVDADVFPQLQVSIDDPSEIGSDLIANAVAAFGKYKRNCVVIDFGTALTFTVVSETGKILGVSIAPGLKTAVKALFTNTAQLPEVPLVLPKSVIGTNTIHSIQAGILWGYEGLVRSMIRKIRRELGGDCVALATGGLSSIISTLHGEFIEVNINLTLEGMIEIAKAHR